MPVERQRLVEYSESRQERPLCAVDVLRHHPGRYFHAVELKDKARAPGWLVQAELWAIRHDPERLERSVSVEAVKGPAGTIYYGVPAGDLA